MTRGGRVLAAGCLLLAALSGCRRTVPQEQARLAEPAADSPPEPTVPAEPRWKGRVHVSTEESTPQRKAIGGAWLESEDGRRLVLTRDLDSPYHAFDGVLAWLRGSPLTRTSRRVRWR